MKIAILILAHKNKDQLGGLINHLKSDFDIYVHIDSHSALELEAEENVVLVDSLPVYWGSCNLVIATLRLFEKAHANNYDRYILISGQDVPLKSNDYIRLFFQDNPDKQFMEFEKLPRESWASECGGFDRLWLYYPNKKPYQTVYTWMVDSLFWVVRKVQKAFPKLKRKIFDNYWGGAEWLNLTGECVEYILDYVRNNEKYLRSFEYTRCSDEIFFQTIIMNSPFAHKCVQNYLRYVDFITGPEYPRILREEDYEKLVLSDALFARKFDANIDSSIIEKVYARASTPTCSEVCSEG
jgi:hypothetical protein